MKPLAVFFAYVWPEPVSSAAGVRTRELMAILARAGWNLAAVSPSGNGPFRDELEALGIRTLSCDPNASPATDAALAILGPAELVLYDRFVMEEQFGWRARARWPEALHVVDTQDLHALRRARERLALGGNPPERVASPSDADLGEDLLRELASLYRADGALVVSTFERAWLLDRGFPAEALAHLPFSSAAAPSPAPFAERSGFCFLGNFRHPPNLDSVRWLIRELWPKVRERLPAAELHLYGAYPPAEISAHTGASGVFARGPVADHRAALARHRALLAPLRFGAGIKGKVLEAWGTGTPAVGTALTFEGMGAGGVVVDSAEEFANAVARLDAGEAWWRAFSEAGLERARADYAPERVAESFLEFVEQGRRDLAGRRERNLTGRLLRHQSANATKYFSRWIEAKKRS